MGAWAGACVGAGLQLASKLRRLGSRVFSGLGFRVQYRV